MQTRYFEDLKDKRLLNRRNSILNRLFSTSVHSIRQLAQNDSEAKAMYRFLQNANVSERDIIKNKKPYWGNHFWSRGYFVGTVVLDEGMIKRYVKYQGHHE